VPGPVPRRASGTITPYDGRCLDLDSGRSVYEYDLYSIRPNGSGCRRITNAPACAKLAHYPKGAVSVPVENYMTEAVVIYFQGAAKPEFSPPG
jgi:hypothetical protein